MKTARCQLSKICRPFEHSKFYNLMRGCWLFNVVIPNVLRKFFWYSGIIIGRGGSELVRVICGAAKEALNFFWLKTQIMFQLVQTPPVGGLKKWWSSFLQLMKIKITRSNDEGKTLAISNEYFVHWYSQSKTPLSFHCTNPGSVHNARQRYHMRDICPYLLDLCWRTAA